VTAVLARLQALEQFILIFALLSSRPCEQGQT